jgi:hypothetical protein
LDIFGYLWISFGYDYVCIIVWIYNLDTYSQNILKPVV